MYPTIIQLYPDTQPTRITYEIGGFKALAV